MTPATTSRRANALIAENSIQTASTFQPIFYTHQAIPVAHARHAKIV